MNTILVTGADGFIGKHLIESLLAHGFAVRATTRGVLGVPSNPRLSFVRIPAIDSHTDWSDALCDVDCVVHLAAKVHVMNPSADDRKLFHETNVLGTESLAMAATRHGVQRLIFLSSIKVNGEATSYSPFNAESPPNPIDDYGQSKWHAEQRLFEIAERGGMKAAAIRSPLVYGPNVKANFFRLMSWVDKGLPLPFGSVNNRRSMISVWNLCDLIVAATRSTGELGVLMASDGEDLSTAQLVCRLSHVMGRSPRLIHVPTPLLRLLGSLSGYGPEIVRLCGSLTVDIDATRRRLGWTPAESVDESLRRTAQWYLREGRKRRA